ncbi:dihydroorotase [Pseudochryseolinea flava]|uniref:Dihydroorotase n=1 Tax=Pseudochryseolinea flava TaxID=2059302 RepID=A0A364Y9Z7_9BACT|nr:dihydroorotase [Pseudochryseolinea flava]RAW03012.1 dihydroorotase [Pseudochryseolinea flava]
MRTTLILNANIVNEGELFQGDVLIKGQYIEKIGKDLSSTKADRVIDAKGKYLLPGVIDDQVHFREPGLTHKATIYTEARSGVAGGVTSFMEMPNTNPPTFTQELLEQKFQIASQTALANHSFFIGASNDNLDEVMKTDITKVCGLKIFMGSSTGNLLVDDPVKLEQFFSQFPSLIAAHCEDEQTIRNNTAAFKEKYGDDIPVESHPLIRNAEACYKSSSFAIGLAKKHGTRFHILHISTAKETALFDNSIPLEKKKITAEACIHHLWFNDNDYKRLGNFIKWNPAVKSANDQQEILKAVLDDRIDVIATDHAPHTLEEKSNPYSKAPSGGPLLQHSLTAMLEFYHQGKMKLEKIVEKMSHNPAILFQINKRGYIREGYFADIVLVDLERPWTVTKGNVLSKCGWSPLEGVTFKSQVTHTFVSGHLAYENGVFDESVKGLRLTFSR